jgi:site-specific DNA-methyltransferase (adenine-specific)
MGKTWDSFVPGPAIWREVYRVLKPGGHALVFAGTRTQDLMTVSLRLAGFEIRDVIEWLYFSGFPKSHNVSKAFDKRAGAKGEVVGKKLTGTMAGQSGDKNAKYGWKGGQEYVDVVAPATDLAKQWDGWGTALKPAHEPIIVARKPLIGTVAENVERWGTGAINIDGCRIGNEVRENPQAGFIRRGRTDEEVFFGVDQCKPKGTVQTIGRFPANIVTTEPDAFWSKYCDVTAAQGNVTPQELSKKASKRDRSSDWTGEQTVENRNPTVKPTNLMAWLVRLVTPPGGVVLDPFAGSGSTLVAAKREGFGFIGIEREAEYIEIAETRTGVQAEEAREAVTV